MSTNDDKPKETEDKTVEEGAEVTDSDLKKLKDQLEGVEPEKEDEPSEEEQAEEAEEGAEGESEESKETESEEAAEEEETESEEETEEETKSEETFTKKYKNIKGDTPEEYAQNLEQAYSNSTSEALKWKKMYEDAQPALKKAEEMAESQFN